MTRNKWMLKLAAVGAAVFALAALAGAALAQEPPPHTFYGYDGTAGDTVGVVGADGAELGSTMVAGDGSWSIEVAADAAHDVSFTLNGSPAEGATMSQGEGLTEVSNLVVAMPVDEDLLEEDAGDALEDTMGEEGGLLEDEDGMGEDAMDEDAMDEDAMGEDAMGEDGMDEDGMDEDAMGEDEMGEDGMDEDAMGEDAMDEGDEDAMDHEFPDTGSGGLADGGVPAGLLGLLIAVGAAAVAGFGLRRVRNRIGR